MNYKQLNPKAKKGSFDFEFLAIIHMCQIYVKLLKDKDFNDISQRRLKELINNQVETLRCFVHCTR